MEPIITKICTIPIDLYKRTGNQASMQTLFIICE